jgi:hypothetical protein
MSAFIVSDEHIASLVSFAVAKKLINSNEAQSAATTLLDANVTSVNVRYKENTTATIDYWSTPKKFLTPIQAVKAAHCLDYQSCEYDGYEGSAAKKLVNRIIGTAIYNIDGYNEAEWAI